jgi:hypothetical protein
MDLADDLDKILGTLAQLYAEEGKRRELALLTYSKATAEFIDTGESLDCYRVNLVVPDTLYHQLGNEIEEIEDSLRIRANKLIRPLYENQRISVVAISPELTTDQGWREKAKATLTGKGITNQGRARSDNLAPLMADGLLFRSQPEINLYRAFKALGITFAPLPVFIRGGESYRRIEPDFVLFKDGVLMIVEVDGDTVHRETPVEAHYRTTMLVHEGAHVERVNAKDCETPEKARQCAGRLLEILKKLKANK